jgi:hypothetical protein
VSESFASLKWTCLANRSVGGNYHQDCGWPTCGCDPLADKVVMALQESGQLAYRPGEREALIEALAPFSKLGGGSDMQAYHDVDEDTVVYKNSGKAITAGDVRRAREVLGPTSMMHFRRSAEEVEELATTTEREEALIEALINLIPCAALSIGELPNPSPPPSNICPHCHRDFPNGETCRMGGCPMGGDV